MVSLSGIFRSLNPWHRQDEDQAEPAPPPSPPVIKIDPKQSQADIIAGIEAALAKGADINKSDWGRETPLCRAANLGLADVVTALIDKGAPVNPPPGEGTPFMAAAEGINPEVLKLLVDRGADPLQPDGIPQDAMVKFFLAHPWEKQKEPGFGERDRATLQFLLDHGLKMEDWNKRTIYTERKELMPLVPELYAVKEFEEAGKAGDVEKMRKMMDEGMKPDAPGTFGGSSPMAEAIRRQDLDTVNLLLNYGADTEVWSGYMTPIMIAADTGAEEIFTRLLGAGADTSKEYTSDRYPDTSVQDLADGCKTNANMGSFVRNAMAHRADYVQEIKKPEVVMDEGTDHTIEVHAPLRLKLKRAPAPA